MTRRAGKICAAGCGLVAVLLFVWLGAHLFTDWSQWARAIAWLDGDYDDIYRFPMRVVSNSGPVFEFQQPSPEVRQRYAPAFMEPAYVGERRAAGQSFEQFMEQTDTVAFLAIKDDVLLYEGYFNGWNRAATVTSFSVAKSFVSALVGIAIAEGHIGSVEDPITKYVPELLEKDPRYQHIRLRHLLTMASGIRYVELKMPWSDDATTYYAPNLRAAAVSSPVAGEPQQQFVYNNYHPLLLGLVLERTTGRPVAKYLEEKIWKPLGMEAAGSWSLDSERSGFEKMESGLNGRAIDFAKFGRLFLNKGNWNGSQLIPAEWVEESTRPDTSTDPEAGYQYMWWVNPLDSGRYHFCAAGRFGQYIYIMPERNMVFVRFGTNDAFNRWREFFEALAERLAALDAASAK